MASTTSTKRAELALGIRQGLLLGAAVLVLVIPPARLLHPPPAAASVAATHQAAPDAQPVKISRKLDLAGQTASDDVRRVAQWVVDTADNGQRAFAIVDKKNARVFVFEPNGRLRDATPVLLGHAAGDDSVPGIGQRPIADVKPEERTTPAGRFQSEPGRNALQEDVVWVDYDAAVSMHRVRLTDPRERRLERLLSPTSGDNRISFGCINMPVAFFDQVLWPVIGRGRGIVYVLPEVKPLRAVFPALAFFEPPPMASASAS